MGMKSRLGADDTLGKQGRVKDPTRDRRIAQNRNGPTGQGLVKRGAKIGALPETVQGQQVKTG